MNVHPAELFPSYLSLQVITRNAARFRNAGKMLEEKKEKFILDAMCCVLH